MEGCAVEFHAAVKVKPEISGSKTSSWLSFYVCFRFRGEKKDLICSRLLAGGGISFIL